MVVDDGSTDADISDLLAGEQITLLSHPGNKGKGVALRTAFAYAKNRDFHTSSRWMRMDSMILRIFLSFSKLSSKIPMLLS